MADRDFTPAAGKLAGIGSYDALIRLFTRENRWRPQLIGRIDPRPGQRLLEVGCGTGTLAIAAKSLCFEAEVIAIDPDPQVLAIARNKAAEQGVEVDFREGFLDQQSFEAASFDTIYCSLVLHQVPPETKTELIDGMIALLKPGGALQIADYAKQSGLMRGLFRLTVQMTDGVADTQPNADGRLEELLRDERLQISQPDGSLATPSGRISLFSRTRK
jgi:ubiquinone/menaquinone biosynthesis C-methylase UbiE